MTTCRDCGATWGGKRLEHCTVCHQTFTGTGAGDKHRVGDYWPNERRCLSGDEMRAKGMRQNDRGHWNLGGTSPWSLDAEAAALAHAAEADVDQAECWGDDAC